MLPGFLRSARAILFALLILAPAAGIIGAAWYAAVRTAESQRVDATQRADTTVTSLAATYAEQVNRQILALDQSLSMMVQEYESDPRRFNLENARARSIILNGISRDMFLADANGIIRQSSVSDFIGQSAGDLEVFRDAAEHANDKPKLYLGSATVNPIMRQWHLDAARTLHNPDGSFAGIIDADYRVSAITAIFAAASPPGNGYAALIDMTDGKLRAAYAPAQPGTASPTPDASIADTPMFAAVDAGDTGIWVGPSASDAVVRIHAFRHLPDSDLAIIVGVDQHEVLGQVLAWQWQARFYAGAVALLTLSVSGLLLSFMRNTQRRAAQDRETQAKFAAAAALAEVARAQAAAIGRRLQVSLAAVSEGVAIFDPHLNLVEWNALFPERSGVNGSFVHTGMPMEDVLRMQAEAGYFGPLEDVTAEVERRTALLRAGNFGASQSFNAGDRTIDMRCRPLTEGGFVALYTDVTEGRLARQALREARAALHREQSARLRFVGVISHELHARVAALRQAIGRPRTAAAPAAGGRSGLASEDSLRLIADSLDNLATDAVEVPLMEANAVVLRPAMVAVRPLLDGIVDAMQPAARDRGVTIYSIVNESAPAELIVDPARIRQIVTLLLAEAVRLAAPETMWLLTDGGTDERGEKIGLRLTVRGFGTPVPEASQAAIFPALDAIAVPEDDDPAAPATSGNVTSPGTGLGPAIARHLTERMGGQLRCEGWSTIDGRTGNDFIMTLPAELLPGQRGRAPGQAPAEGRPLPRTRILLAGEATGLRLAAVTMLRRDGHMVDAVPTGEEAVQSLQSAPYDILFVDSVLPDMTVAGVVATLRELPGPTRTIPVVALIPAGEDPDTKAWRAIDVAGTLPNPPTLDDLTTAIGRHVWLVRAGAHILGFMPGLEDETEEGIPILSAERIDELRANLPADELLEMVEECIADLFHRLPALRRCLAAGAPGAITAQTHAMVGMAGGYGMAVLEARLRAILTATRNRRLDTIDGAAEVVENDLTRAAAALRRRLRQTQPRPQPARP